MATTKKATAEKATDKKKSVSCWKGYKKVGTKTKGGKKVNDCVPD